MGRIIGVVAAWLLLACSSGAAGGSGPAETPDPVVDGPVTTTTPEDTTWLTDARLDDTFLWAVLQPGLDAQTLSPSQDANPILHVQLDAAPLRATIFTHHHFDLMSMASHVRFMVKARSPMKLGVSVMPALDADYFAARDAGRVWPVATIDVSSDW